MLTPILETSSNTVFSVSEDTEVNVYTNEGRLVIEDLCYSVGLSIYPHELDNLIDALIQARNKLNQ